MLKSCKYCGRIHDSKLRCGSSRIKMIPRTDKDKFRSTYEWQKKRNETQERDRYLCQACIRNLPGTKRRYEYENTSVHHIIPLEEDYEKRLDDDNLITLCQYHHEQAEKGIISREELQQMIPKMRYSPPGG